MMNFLQKLQSQNRDLIYQAAKYFWAFKSFDFEWTIQSRCVFGLCRENAITILPIVSNLPISLLCCLFSLVASSSKSIFYCLLAAELSWEIWKGIMKWSETNSDGSIVGWQYFNCRLSFMIFFGLLAHRLRINFQCCQRSYLKIN